MTKGDFTMPGFVHFYRSLLRWGQDMRSAEAAELTYLLYTAIVDSYRYKNTGADIEEYGPVEFYGNLKSMERRPYRTEVQLYRSAEAILAGLICAALTKAQLMAVLQLCAMMDNAELRFYKAFDVEIDDKRTVYGECFRSLVPREDEPDRLVIEVPFDGFTNTALDNLEKLVASKAALIKKALTADGLPIVRKGVFSRCFVQFYKKIIQGFNFPCIIDLSIGFTIQKVCGIGLFSI